MSDDMPFKNDFLKWKDDPFEVNEGCKGYRTWEGDYDCGYPYATGGCEDCIFGPYPDANSFDPRVPQTGDDE